jgi:uncharacterized membrane protein YraQ (UPF0718 family)
MIEILRREAIYLWYYFSIQFQQIIVYYVLGMALGSLVSVFCKEKINSMFASLHGSKLGAFGIIPAALLGIASPLCMYGTVPLAASFASRSGAEKGMVASDGSAEDTLSRESEPSREGELAAFMMGSVLLNPQLLFYSAALGTPALVIRFSSCFLCAVTAGVLIRRFFKKKKFFDFSGFSSETENRDKDPNLPIRFLKNYGRNIKATAVFFIAGIALSAIFQRYVPPEGFARLFGNRGFGLLMAATVGVPLYVCGGGTIPLLQTWLYHGMGMGSAAAFMITGPAAKLTNLGALKIVLGIKNFLFYLLFAITFALLCGAVIDIILFF